jgi:hypothetical protein
MARQVERVPERVGRIASLRNGRQIKDGKRDHGAKMGVPSAILNRELITCPRNPQSGAY